MTISSDLIMCILLIAVHVLVIWSIIHHIRVSIRACRLQKKYDNNEISGDELIEAIKQDKDINL